MFHSLDFSQRKRGLLRHQEYSLQGYIPSPLGLRLHQSPAKKSRRGPCTRRSSGRAPAVVRCQELRFWEWSRGVLFLRVSVWSCGFGVSIFSGLGFGLLRLGIYILRSSGFGARRLLFQFIEEGLHAFVDPKLEDADAKAQKQNPKRQPSYISLHKPKDSGNRPIIPQLSQYIVQGFFGGAECFGSCTGPDPYKTLNS